MIEKFLDENIEKMKADLGKLVSYNSELNNDGGPFGKQNQLVLAEAIKMMDGIGLKTRNLEDYCGYGEIGEGDKTIGVVCHLDVVPCSDGWNSDPFTMIEKDGYLYGRGVSDDKGAAVASMYALKYLIESGYKFKKKVRLILGCNEETGSKCIKHYVESEGNVDMGFTPDGDFPGIYAEKGMIGGMIAGPSKIIDIKGGDASNIVCKRVFCKVEKGSYDEKKFESYLNNANIRFEQNEGEITVYGKAAHASLPDDGINAINYLFEALYAADFKDDYVECFHKYIGLDVHGEKLGYEALKDDVSNTSINIGVIGKEDGIVKASLDMRFPVKSTVDKCVKLVEKIRFNEVEFKLFHTADPLFFDKSSPMIKALKKAYEDVTGDKKTEMEAIGGGTYAKSIKGIIAFGCEFIGEENNIHGANERLSIESFRKQVILYVEAIKNLNEV